MSGGSGSWFIASSARMKNLLHICKIGAERVVLNFNMGLSLPDPLTVAVLNFDDHLNTKVLSGFNVFRL